MNKQIYGKYRKRIVKEGILKSLFFGIIFGSLALVSIGFLTWFFDYKPGLFISIAAFIVIAATITPLLYFLHYRPTVKQIAYRVDALGLEERVITMEQLEGDDSDIAKLQREDTVKALKSVDHMLLKIAISAALFVPLIACCVLGTGMLTVSSLHYAGIIPSGLVTLTPEYNPGVYTVIYSVEEGGEGVVIYWTGDWSQETPVNENGDKVKEGENAKAVYAIPADNWAFVSWSDGYSDPYRQDMSVDADIFVQAIFEEIEADPDGEQAEDNANNESGDGEGDKQEGEGGEEGESGQEGEPESAEGDAEAEGQEGNSNNEPQGQPDQSGATGARDQSSQQIVDGNTYYGDQFEDAYQEAQDRLGSDSNIPDDLKDYVEDYFDSIETGGRNNGK